MENLKVPEIIDVKIGSKLEAKWTETMNRIEETLIIEEINEKIAKITKKSNEEILELTKAQIEIEKERYK